VTTLRQVKAAALKIGANVDDHKSGNCHTCTVEAPHRKKWACRGVHEMVDETNQPWKPDYADMLDNMNFGLEDCEDPDCEWCNEESE
jgi:hypothetical protein